MPGALYRLQGCAIQPTWSSLKKLQALERFFCMRSTFYAEDYLQQPSTLSCRRTMEQEQPSVAMDTIYSTDSEECSIEYQRETVYKD
jgi:hypothetical protein